jgi:alpha-galactosidase
VAVQLHFDRVAGNGLSYVQAPNGAGATYDWSLTNTETVATRVRAVALVFRVEDVRGALRMFRHGYQSWSPSDVATFGADVDPSTQADNEFFQAMHHADQRTVTAPGELRSEWFTVLADDDGVVLAAFIGGAGHDGTLRLRHSDDGHRIELHAEAFLGDAEIPPQSTRALHSVIIEPGTSDVSLLEGWVKVTGATALARTTAPYQVGWCSWYHYFHDVTEEAVRSNLALANAYPFDVLQLDDGYQAAIGDWLETNDKFPSGLAAVASAVNEAGYTPGIWIAPFLAAPDSQVATQHPEWVATFTSRRGATRPLRACWNPIWGNADGGYMYALDTTLPAVQQHLRDVASALVTMGFTYIKLDFTYAPSYDGNWYDPTRTPAERVRAGFDAFRLGSGDEVFLLGCGAPLSHVVGVVDGNRIGPDVAPLWEPGPSTEVMPGYLRTQPATKFADDATRARAFMHRRLWLNDPDCLMLRTEQTDLSHDDTVRWAATVAASGGMALVSDDLALLDANATELLQETIATGRASDAATQAGRCPLVASLF